MRSPKLWCVLLAFLFIAPGQLAFAQNAKPAAADEVEKLRQEVSELRAQMQALIKASAQKPPAEAPAAPAGAAPSKEAGAATAASRVDVDALQKDVKALQAKAAEAPKNAGWNGEHFFLRSSDGEFQMMPVGYVGSQYTLYNGDGAPPNSFAITRARFGVQGNYGKQLDYSFVFETVSSPTVRDAFVDLKLAPEFKVMAGLNKVPFSMEVGTGDTAVEFYNRSIIQVLYPDAGGGFRAPGLDLHGEIDGGRMDYHAGAFNGQGLLGNATTSQSELVGRLRFVPWKGSTEMKQLAGLSFGFSAEHSRSRGLSGEQSFSGAMNDGTYTFFPQFRINGGVRRYNAFASYLNGPLGIRAEWANLTQARDNIGSLATGGIAFNSQPDVKGNGFYVSATYLLTGEEEPANALPRVKHPVIGPNSPGESGAPGWGAWSLKFRFSHLSASAPGSSCNALTVPACPLTPVIAPGFSDRTSQYTFGVNWYLNYWIVLKTDINIDQLKDPSVQGIMPQNYKVLVESLQYRF